MPHTLSQSIFAILAAVLTSGTAFCQFGDDAASKAKMANACAISGGGNAADYQSYASGLAKTLSHLSAAEQAEVLEGTGTGGTGTGGTGTSGTGTGGTGSDGGTGWGSGGGGGIGSWFTYNEPSHNSGKGHVFAVALHKSQTATAEVSFTNAPVTETVFSGEFSLTSNSGEKRSQATAGTMTQAVDPAGNPIFRAEDNAPRDNATISFKGGKLSFGPKEDSPTTEGGDK